ncbi:DUF2249 domain-containing protein [Pseudoduganella danionis]|uniref:DUF2249 domain-containing protein n=2 Tax=Telluria group TaxID=2895353 RepID=A0A845I0P4_9BURK|nr:MULTISPECIES: DUF2249 domain-containing protein [Telluria group]MTW34480.1 DUF2249 domain-containing protein [Pseudoduganella danionis]MYN45637.1 DUF2249 domain-containing protein [Duganella fentianensis]
MTSEVPNEVQIDVSGLEPPEPMVRVLEALDLLADDGRLRVLIDRQPVPLYQVLQRNGYSHLTTARADGLYEVLIWITGSASPV